MKSLRRHAELSGHPRIRIRCVPLSPPSPALPRCPPSPFPPLLQTVGFDGFPLSISLLISFDLDSWPFNTPSTLDPRTISTTSHSLLYTSHRNLCSSIRLQQTTVLSRNHPPFLICALQFHNKEIRFLHRHYPSSRHTIDHR